MQQVTTGEEDFAVIPQVRLFTVSLSKQHW
jgi:hypothetical protein